MLSLFTLETEKNNTKVCLSLEDEDFKREKAKINFSPKILQEGMDIKEILGNDCDTALRINHNPIDILDDIYKFIYGKPLEQMYIGYDFNNYESIKQTDAVEWTKERASKINWEVFVSTLYAFYFSEEDFYSDVWKSLAQLLNIFKKFNSDEWKRLLFGKTIDTRTSVQKFWEFIEIIACKKYISMVKNSATNVVYMPEIRNFVSSKSCTNMASKTIDYFMLQIDSEFNRLQNIKNFSDRYVYEFYLGLGIVATYNSFFNDEKIIEKFKSYISHCFMRLGDLCKAKNLYELANKTYSKALVYATNKAQKKTIWLQNKEVCKHIPISKRVSIWEEKHKHRMTNNNKYNDRINKLKNIGQIILIPSAVIFAIAAIVFLVLMIVGLIFSNSLFVFSWKALLPSLGLAILTFAVFYFMVEKL